MADTDFPFAEQAAELAATEKEIAEAPVEQPEQPAAVETAPEQPAKVEPDQTKDQGKPQLVPLSALHEERNGRKELAKRLEASEARAARVEQTLNRLFEEANKPEPVAVPDINGDPVAHLKHGIDTQGKTVEQLAKDLADLKGQTETERQEAAQYSAYVEATQQFAATAPDYGQAFDFAVKARDAQLALEHEDAAERAKIIDREIRSLVRGQLQKGKNPAAYIYEFAKLSGYKSQAAQPGAAQKLQTIANGQRQSASLSAVSGGAEGKLSIEELANMDGDAFLAAFKQGKLGDPARWKRLMSTGSV